MGVLVDLTPSEPTLGPSSTLMFTFSGVIGSAAHSSGSGSVLIDRTLCFCCAGLQGSDVALTGCSKGSDPALIKGFRELAGLGGTRFRRE